MDKETWPTRVLPTRHPAHNKKPTQTASDRLEKIFQEMGKEKKSWSSNTYVRQNRLQNKGQKRDTEGHFIILKGRIHQKDINIVNINVPNIGAPKCISKILEDFKRDIDS